ncbi:MAG: M20/M25/M40 family metallo-hydrolase, partial [Deltaproteobacteria bacterium]|nr:M20/M25/M40 family metallo-hydrolase [Deltaproteobacteria bacterium]
HTDSFLEEHKKLLAADAVALSDTAWFAEGFPCIQTALRGLCYMEITVKGPDHDLHSGSFGGIVANPLNVLGHIIAGLQDEDGKILIPGFYDDVLKPTDEELEGFKKLPYNDAEMKRCAGVSSIWGESEFTPLERIWIRPTLDVNGLIGGYTGEGSKTVITTRGTAKISMRLVADQNPVKIAKQFEQYVKKMAPKGIELEAKKLTSAYPVHFPASSKFVQGASRAMEQAFGKKPTFIREAFSIPITYSFLKILNAPSVLIALGHPDDNLHGPNEKFSLEHFFGGIKMAAYFLNEF